MNWIAGGLFLSWLMVFGAWRLAEKECATLNRRLAVLEREAQDLTSDRDALRAKINDRSSTERVLREATKQRPSGYVRLMKGEVWLND